ncbi:MAG: GumC family protein [Leptolyngbyaceae cyanobacterium]
MNFVRNVIDLNLQYLFAATRRGMVPATTAFILTVLGAGAVARMMKPSYLAESKLLFKLDRAASLTGLEQGDAGPLSTVTFAQSPLNSEIEVITSKPLIQKAINTLQLEDNDGKSLKIPDFLEDLQVQVIYSTDVLSFAYLDEDPVKAADILNTLMELYRSEKLASTQVDTANAREFLDQQLPITAEQVRETEYELRIFRETYNVVDLQQETNSAVTFLDNLRKEQADIQATLQERAAIAETLGSELQLSVSDAIKANSLSQSPQIQNILLDLHKVRRDIAAQQVEFTEESPIVSDLRAEEASLSVLLEDRVNDVAGSGIREGLLQMGATREKLIEQYVDNDIKLTALTERLRAVNSNIQEYQERINRFPELEQRQRDLERKLSAAQQTYQELLNKRQELQVKENQITNFIQVIEPAIPPEKPSSQVAVKIIAMGIIAGFVLAISIIVAIDFFIVDVKGTNKIYDPDTYNLPADI